MNNEMLKMLFYWISERQNIWYKRRILKEPPPWTDDEILKKYRFCNCYRELDKGSLYLINNIANKYINPSPEQEKEIILNTIIYRLFNRPDTFEVIGWQKPEIFDRLLISNRLSSLDTIWNTAYMVYGALHKEFPKKHDAYLYIIEKDVIENLDSIYENVKNAGGLKDIHKELMKIRGIASFLSYEITIDINYSPIVNFSENDWGVIGLGARPMLQYIYGDETDDFSDENCLIMMKYLTVMQDFYFNEFYFKFTRYNDKFLTLRNIEHSLCETRKYYHLKNGKGRRRLFKPIT